MVAQPEAAWRVEALAGNHDREGFTCGVQPLDRYLRRQASQDVRGGVTAVFVLTSGDGAVAGYYTLSSSTIHLTKVPPEHSRKLPRYEAVPATLLGRLAIDQRYQGQRLGGVLLFDALKRAHVAAKQVASWAVIVDAKDDSAKAFYEHFDFREVLGSPYRLFLPMKKIDRLLATATK